MSNAVVHFEIGAENVALFRDPEEHLVGLLKLEQTQPTG